MDCYRPAPQSILNSAIYFFLRRVMTAEFEFLKPWHTVLQNKLTTREPRTVLQTLFSLPVGYNAVRTFYVKLSVDGRSRRDLTQLQHLREALELFTALSFVNNRAFAKFFPSSRPDSSGEFCYSYPKWCVRLSGTLLLDDIAAIVSPVTWNTLLGFPDDSCTRADTTVYGGHKIIGSADTLGELLVRFQNLFNLNVPPLAQLYATDNGMTLANAWQHQEPPCKYLLVYVRYRWDASDSYVERFVGVHVFIVHFWFYIKASKRNTIGKNLFHLNVPPLAQLNVTDNGMTLANAWQQQEPPCNYLMVCVSRSAEIQNLATALSKTISFELDLTFDCITLDTTKMKRAVGVLLNSLFRNGKHGKVELTCMDVSETVFTGTCSAVAELCSKINLSLLHTWMYSVTRERWSWLTYALCCGNSGNTVPDVEIVSDALTKADLLAIKAVLKTNYPLPVPENGCEIVAQYGFVDIREGAHLRLGEFSDSNESRLVISCASRCRARYNPASPDDYNVEMIVPGCGVCKGKLGDAIQFTPDCGTTNLQQKRISGSLELKHVRAENAALLMDLLTLITRRLRKLTIIGKAGDIIQVDLTLLSAACPDLQEFHAGPHSTVRVSAHDKALRSWPIKSMTIDGYDFLSDLSSCLKNPSLRMTRELLKLEVWRPRRSPSFNEEKEEILKAHDGEFLPVAKEKVPLQSKLALMSVVTRSGNEWKAVHRMDAHVLSLIFVFASTPAQRIVKFHY